MGELRRILELLGQHNVEFVLVGGYAAMAHGVSLVTRDVDICTHFPRENLERIHAAVANLHPYDAETPQKIPFTIPAGLEKGLRNFNIATDIGRLDCLGEVLGIGDYAATRAVSIPLQLPFGSVWMLDRKAMIRAKSALDRPHDKVTVMQLMAMEERDRAGSN